MEIPKEAFRFCTNSYPYHTKYKYNEFQPNCMTFSKKVIEQDIHSITLN